MTGNYDGAFERVSISQLGISMNRGGKPLAYSDFREDMIAKSEERTHSA